MTSTTTTESSSAGTGMVGGNSALTDGMIIAWRNLKRIPRVPDQAMWGTVQPIMFVLLVAYVFGGAVPIPGYEPDPAIYREFLMAGIFAQTMAFAVASSSVGLADDMQKGLVDRFRSLPIARSAVISGRVVGDLVFNSFIMVVMVVCALLVGWRWHNGVLQGLAGFALLLAFAFAMLWVGALVGLSVRSVEVAASAGLIWLFPVTFLSTAFVPMNSQPGWIQAVAEWNPFSAVVTACRQLFGNPVPPSDAFPMQHAVAMSWVYIALIIAVFAPLAVRKYQQAASR